MSSTTKSAAKASTPAAAKSKAKAKAASARTLATRKPTKAAPRATKAQGAGHAVCVLIGHGSYGETIEGVSRVYLRDVPVLVPQEEAGRLAKVGVLDLDGHNFEQEHWAPAFLVFDSVASFEAAAAKAEDAADEKRRKAARAEAERILREAMAPKRPRPSLRKHVSLLRGDS